MTFKINGRMYDWASIDLGMAGMPIPSFTSIDYSDEAEQKQVYGKGRKPVGYARGNYSAAGKVTLHREAYEGMMAAAATLGKGGLYDLNPIPVTVTYANPDKPPVSDTLKGCVFTKRSTSNSQNMEAATVDLEFICHEIAWGAAGLAELI
ncbi:MAG: hypothetical protein HUU55_07650 [Myxococcales bacterium]|nr:hypothetical protein [Myxococcales bacterium]